MAVKGAAAGTGMLLVTANVGSLFDDPENLQKNWLREFYQIVHTHKPHFMALHCQEFGGKNYEASMSHVDKFVKELLSSDAMKDYNRARVYLDENYKSQEHFTMGKLSLKVVTCPEGISKSVAESGGKSRSPDSQVIGQHEGRKDCPVVTC